MPRKSSLFILLFVFFSAKAQHAGYVLISKPESFRNSFSNATAVTQSIQSEFNQEKYLSMLSEKINSSGKFWYKKKSQLRIEYVRPFSYLVIINEGKIFIKDGEKESKISTGSNKILQQMNRMLLDCVSGNMLESPDFQSRVFESREAWLVELTPVTRNLKKLYKNINIVIDKSDFTANTIEMIELSGDKTSIHFKNKVLNAQIPSSIFSIP
jgi:outer membrane lipoprotein-sorting protein